MSILRSFGFPVLTSLCLYACASPSSAPDSDPDEEDINAQSTTITFPLIALEWNDRGGTWVPLESLNGDLERVGLEPFETSVTVGRADADKAKFDAVVAHVEAASEKLGRDLEFFHGWGDYNGLCYTGRVNGVRKTVEALRGTAFSQYMGMAGYRYNTTKKFVYGSFGVDESEFFNMHREDNGNQVKAWEEFDTSSDAFLMMTDGGQEGDGTELLAVPIARCK